MSVSKQFKSMIQNPQFIEAHLASLQNSPKQYYMLSQTCRQTLFSNALNYTWKPIKVPRLRTKTRPRVIGNSAGGVVCLKHNANFFLWNPSIQKVRIVPAPVGSHDVPYGFGFDHVNLDFKVVRLFSYDHGSRTGKAMVYGVKSGCWRTVDSKVPCWVPTSSHDQYTVHVNGNSYWTGMRMCDDWCILGFDFANEVFKVIDLTTMKGCISRLSTSSDGKSLVGYLTNIEGRYHNEYPKTYCTSWSVWYLSTVTDSIWEKKYDLVLDMPFCPLCVILDDDSRTVLAQFENGTQWVVNGVKEGSYLSAATEVNKVDAVSSTFAVTSYTYTPSLAFLIDDSEQVD